MPVRRLPYELNPYTATFSMRVTNCQSECPFARRIVLTRDKCYPAGSYSTPPTPTSQEGRWGGDHRGGAEETKSLQFRMDIYFSTRGSNPRPSALSLLLLLIIMLLMGCPRLPRRTRMVR